MHAIKKLAIFLHCGFLALLLAGAFIRPATAAPSCDGHSSNLMFGTVNLLAGGVTDATSTISYGCSADPGTVVLLCVSLGADPNTGLYTLRNLGSGSNRMAFNFYTDAARSTIWGAVGAAGGYAPVPIIMTFGSGEYYKSATTLLYGRIQSAGQTGLPSGTYDTGYISGWPMKIDYKAVANSTSASCANGGMSNKSSSFYAQAVVKSDCRIDSASTMDFGTVFQTLSQNIDSAATITVTCNGGMGANGYKVGLGNGTNASGTQRRMKGPGGGYVNYELYRDAQRSSRWGNDYNTSLPGVGNGLPQALTVYGRVPPQSAPGIGLFTDTVVITISY
ncbi:Csu type fimbrial protein [Eoetvoesiella caeni]|uniref:Spore coat protein U-like protein n=1 Tax=Eoetvoesiella caeni TaxID=645616 RepID=A0A366HBH3_9BURK|nr:spore coat protein U domain-containing protein [Eoetvoesiella caeni]MCI2809590.1 spore coat U domain-containing protein [Eoetvoesiella caeni]NYT56086.1 spore coat U domain-containing protein [Eoetvoesiella caeni]RBP38851.1 spore coat protein U-like protein [Eoetvoesiella caeni]